VTEWEQSLTDAGCRVTAPRRAVMQVLQEARVPLLPQDILTQGRREHGKLVLVTVYRTLALLEQLNLVRRVHRKDGCHGYLLASPGHRHALICQGCGEIAWVEAKTGYQVADHLLQLFGLCPDCRETET